MEIIKASPEDLDKIMPLYAAARKFMASTGNPNQWAEGYPPKEDLKTDIENGCLYICRAQGEIEGVFKFITYPDPTYSRIIGSWLDTGPYGTLHRVVSRGNVKRLFDTMVSWSLERCSSLRADTHRDNTVMQNAFKRNGFKYCGIIFLENGDERLAYQLVK